MSLNKNSFVKGKMNIPTSPPPSIVPLYCKVPIEPTPELLNAYINTIIYLWLSNGNEFWMCPKYVNGNILCGYVWSGDSWESACFNCKLIKSIY